MPPKRRIANPKCRWRAGFVLGTNPGMEAVGSRLRSRALDLGLSDAEVARRAGLSTTRYGHYVTDYREPDLATLVRICRVLGLRPDELLAYEQPVDAADKLVLMRRKITGFVETMDAQTLELAVLVMQALAATSNLRQAVPGNAGSSPGLGNKRRSKRTKTSLQATQANMTVRDDRG